MDDIESEHLQVVELALLAQILFACTHACCVQSKYSFSGQNHFVAGIGYNYDEVLHEIQIVWNFHTT